VNFLDVLLHKEIKMKKAITLLALLSIVAFAQGTFTDPRDKKKYKTVKIGDQTWMAQNLDYNAKGSVCYGNKAANCTKYGRLYDWATAKEACPSGWLLPDSVEWSFLFESVGGQEEAGKKLKAKSGWNKFDAYAASVPGQKVPQESGNGTDKFGFAALPGGESYPADEGKFEARDVGDRGYWWSSSEFKGNKAYYLPLLNNGEDASLSDMDNDVLISVRCFQISEKDKEAAEAKRAKIKQDAEAKAKAEADRIAAMSFTDSRDKRVYKKTTVGKQVWMAENLDFAAEGSKCYDNKDANCTKYGKLYNWEIAQKSCPTGWHLPTKEEYGELDKAAGGEKTAGKKLKSSSGWNGTDDFGFTALPGGFSFDEGKFKNVNAYGDWWIAGEKDGKGLNRFIGKGDNVSWGEDVKTKLRSVRCVQN
jgi:uncharacterized protein (TIGR02145 family)